MNRKMNLSKEGKIILDELTEQLSLERPFVIQIALAKGIQITEGVPDSINSNNNNKWTIPDNIIKEDKFLLFKYLIQNEVGKPLNNEELHDYFIKYIEIGLRKLDDISKEKTSMEDIRIAILN